MTPHFLAFACLVATASLPPERMSKAQAVAQLATHSCFVRLPTAALAGELDACVAQFPKNVVFDDDGRCARYGVVGERLLYCQSALVAWQQAQLQQDAPAELAALVRAQKRCQASALCPSAAVTGVSFRRPSPQRPHTR